ncbi:MAG: DUF4381 family protein [Vicinamibacterales bacterium]
MRATERLPGVLALAWLALFAARPVEAQDVRLTASFRTTTCLLGAPCVVDVSVESREPVDDIAVQWPAQLGSFEVRSVEPLTDGWLTRSGTRGWRVTLQAFDAGRASLPAITAAYTRRGDTTSRTTTSAPVAIAVEATPLDPSGQLRDIVEAEPPPPPIWRRPAPWFVIGGAAVALLVWWWRRSRRRTTSAVAGVPALASADVLAQLAALGSARFSSWVDLDRWVSAVLGLVRRFARQQLDAPIETMSTPELADVLATKLRLPPSRVADWFAAVDRIRFGRATVPPGRPAVDVAVATDVVTRLAQPGASAGAPADSTVSRAAEPTR